MQINDAFNLVLLEKFCVFIVIAVFVFFDCDSLPVVIEVSSFN